MKGSQKETEKHCESSEQEVSHWCLPGEIVESIDADFNEEQKDPREPGQGVVPLDPCSESFACSHDSNENSIDDDLHGHDLKEVLNEQVPRFS